MGPRHESRQGNTTTVCPRATGVTRATGVARLTMHAAAAPAARQSNTTHIGIATGTHAHQFYGEQAGGLSPPREGAWIATEIQFSTDHDEGGERRSRRILAFQPECNPPAHTTPASRSRLRLQTLLPDPLEGQLDNTVGAPMADTVGPTRRSLAPAANTSPHPP